MDAMEQNAKENPEKIQEVKQVVQEGNRVVVFSHIRQNKNDCGAAVVHIFRFNNENLIEELWDVGMAIPENSINENSVF